MANTGLVEIPYKKCNNPNGDCYWFGGVVEIDPRDRLGECMRKKTGLRTDSLNFTRSIRKIFPHLSGEGC